MPLTRRAVVGGAFATAALTILRARGQAAETQPTAGDLVTFSQWLAASAEERQRNLQRCLDRISRDDRIVQAWKQVRPQPRTSDGPLADIPFGVKDLIETKGLATEYGSPIYEGRIGTYDAAIVRLMRERGGILLGKTHTAAFAYKDPPPTRNPRNPQHTPGGSSSGSAAAVAAGMVPVAVGTQTGGSVLRPASFCGVAGFKTTFGALPMEGVLPYARSFDTLGFFTHTAEDMLSFWGALGMPTGKAEEFDFGAPEPLPDVDAEMRKAFAATITRLKQTGIRVRPLNIAGLLNELHLANRVVCAYEASRFHEETYKKHGQRMGIMGNLVREGLEIPDTKYASALRTVAAGRARFSELYESTPVILAPAAPGPAPKGLSSTGDSRINTPWSSLGTPAISIPMQVGRELPLGLQVTAAHHQDARVIRAAIKIDRIIRDSV